MAFDENEKRNAILAAIIDYSGDAIISKDLHGYITSWNKSAERLFGYTAEEAIGKHIAMLIPSDRLAEEDMIISMLRQGRRIDHYETVRINKEGKEIPISLTVSPIKGEDGTITGASKIARDITKKKESELLIQQYAGQLEMINSIGKSILAELNEEVILQKVTDTATHAAGAAFGAFFHNKVDMNGQTYMLYTLSGVSRAAFEKFGMPRNTAVFKKTFDGEGIFLSDDITKDPRYGHNAPHKGMPEGHLPVVSYLAVPVFSKSGSVIGGLFFGHPKAAMFRQEHVHVVSAIATFAAIALDNAKLYEEIKALNAQKDEFISFASHELKTPLTTISGYVQLAQKQPALSNEFIPKITKQVTRLNSIISDLLDISKIQAGRMDLNFTTITLQKLIEDSIESVEINSSTHLIECEIPTETISLVIDAQKIEQVIVNLLTNAIKYSSHHNKILLRATLLGDEMHVSVQDWGKGIAAEYMDKIFNRFYRIPGKNRPQGLGLGLYISREIMEAHHGKIWVESEPEKGSVFHISFPIERAKMYRS